MEPAVMAAWRLAHHDLESMLFQYRLNSILDSFAAEGIFVDERKNCINSVRIPMYCSIA